MLKFDVDLGDGGQNPCLAFIRLWTVFWALRSIGAAYFIYRTGHGYHVRAYADASDWEKVLSMGSDWWRNRFDHARDVRGLVGHILWNVKDGVREVPITETELFDELQRSCELRWLDVVDR